MHAMTFKYLLDCYLSNLLLVFSYSIQLMFFFTNRLLLVHKAFINLKYCVYHDTATVFIWSFGQNTQENRQKLASLKSYTHLLLFNVSGFVHHLQKQRRLLKLLKQQKRKQNLVVNTHRQTLRRNCKLRK